MSLTRSAEVQDRIAQAAEQASDHTITEHPAGFRIRLAVVYARITRDRANQLEGVTRQVNDGLERINASPDLRLNTEIEGSLKDPKHPELGRWPNGVLVDNDMGNRKNRKRPEYERLMRYVFDGDVTAVVSLHPFRLWRNATQSGEAVEKLKNLDLKLIFLKFMEIDLSNATGRFIAGLMAQLGQLEVDLAEERQKDAIRPAAKAGAYHGARPFGFQLAHANPDGTAHLAPKSAPDGSSGFCEACEGRKASRYRTLIPDPTEAVAVREAYEMIAAGVTPYAVCQYLDGQEIDGPDGTRLKRAAIKTATGKTWEQVGVQGLLVVLRAKRNIGVREWSKGWAGGKRPIGEVHPAYWDGIVSQELFDAVQVALALRHKARPGGNTPAHLLTGFAFCGNCGRRLRIHRVGGKRRYACSAWSGKGCVSFEADVAEREVELYLFKWLAKNTMLAKALEHTGDADLQKLYRTRGRLGEQREQIENDLDDGRFDMPDGTRDMPRYRARLARKDDQLAEVDREIDMRLHSLKGKGDGKSFPTGTAFRTEWNSADLDGKRSIVRRFIDKVTIYPAGAGNAPDPRLVQIHPGSWAAGIEDAQPLSAPDPVSFTSRGKILEFVNEHPGEWFTRLQIADGTGLTPNAVYKALDLLTAEVASEWRKRGGQRACFMYTASSGESWGPRTRKMADGGTGARQKIRAVMEAEPSRWFTASEITELSHAGGAPHVTRTLNTLIVAGFAQRRGAPLPRKHVRYEYSINGK